MAGNNARIKTLGKKQVKAADYRCSISARSRPQYHSPCFVDLLPLIANFMDYQVNLDTFRGPLDLLLYLVKRNEVDICDIPIAKMTVQFQEYLQAIQVIDVEGA